MKLADLKDKAALEALKNSRGTLTLKAVRERLTTLAPGDEQKLLEQYLEVYAAQRRAKKQINKLFGLAEEAVAEMLDGDHVGEELEDIRIVDRWLVLHSEISETRSTKKAAETTLDAIAHAKYPELTQDEVIELVVNDKWLATLANLVHGELDRISQALTRRLRELADRYETPLPEVTAQVDAFQKRVDVHLQRIGLAKKRLIKQGVMGELLTGQRRLPEFEEEWQKESLGSLGTWLSGGTPSKKNEGFWSGDIPWVSPKDMKQPRLFDSIDHVSDAAIGNGTRLLPRGALLIVVRGMILAHSVPVARCERPVAFNQDIKALVVREGVDSNFLLWWLVAHERLLLSKTAMSTHGTKRLPTEDLFGIEIPLPKLEEQEEIARVVSDVDEEITALDERLRKARRIKRGVMQRLLTGYGRSA